MISGNSPPRICEQLWLRMNADPTYTRNHLFLSIAMITCLTLLITVSFKIIAVHGFFFTAGSVLCPLIAGLYLLVLNQGHKDQQRQVLNQALLALYVFSIGVFILVNLPTIENIRANIAYEIFFEDIPRKFFSATLAFGLGFYLLFLYYTKKIGKVVRTPQQYFTYALIGGFLFFSINFILLFSEPKVQNFWHLYGDSLMVFIGMQFCIGLFYLLFVLRRNSSLKAVKNVVLCYRNPHYQYLVSFSVIILLICLACEYRLISMGNVWMFVASGILFPLNFILSNLVGELYGYKANVRMIGMLLFSEVAFNFILTILMLLPSSDYFDLNPFYCSITPRRIPAATFALILAMGSNAFLLEKLKNTFYGKNRGFRIFAANFISNTLLCIVNYTILFVGIYPYELILNLAVSTWIYKFVISLVSLPLLFWLCDILQSYALSEKTESA